MPNHYRRSLREQIESVLNSHPLGEAIHALTDICHKQKAQCIDRKQYARADFMSELCRQLTFCEQYARSHQL